MIDSARAIGRPDRAIERTREFLRTHPFKSGFKSLYAQILEESGSFEEAISVVMEILSRDPDHRVAKMIAARHEDMLGSRILSGL